MRRVRVLCAVLALMTVLGSAFAAAEETPQVYVDGVQMEASMEDEAALITEGEAALPDLMNPTAPGTLVEENHKARIDLKRFGVGSLLHYVARYHFCVVHG